MASDNSDVLAAIAGLKEVLASTDSKVAIVLAQTSAIQNSLADLGLSVSQLAEKSAPDTTTVNEIIAVASAVDNIASDIRTVIDLIQNIPVEQTEQGLA